MTDAPCQTCHARNDAYLCPTCTTTLHHDLTTVKELLTDLAVTITRQDRVHGNTRRGGSEPPNPVGWAAAEVRDTIHALTRRYARALGHTAGGDLAWLTANTHQIRTQEWAGEFAGQVESLVSRDRKHPGQAWKVIDRPDTTIRIACPRCGGRVPVDPEEVTECKRCRTDGTTDGERMYGVASWWAQQVAPPGELIRLSEAPLVMPRYDWWNITRRKVEQWIEEGHLECLCTDVKGARLVDPVKVAMVAARMEARKRKVRA